jgi:hypothetical protein
MVWRGQSVFQSSVRRFSCEGVLIRKVRCI